MYKSIVEGKGGISAKVVADSISDGKRLTTMELNYHRYIHSEFMTHRMFSRNASSSRAIPVAKMVEQVQKSPATPIHWGKNQPGMQARKVIDGDYGYYNWREAASNMARKARLLDVVKGYHKQVVNRLLEPFQFIRVVVTATEWDNFFALRDHPDAQPEIQELARVMKQAMAESDADELYHGSWHLPYVDLYGKGWGELKQFHEPEEAAIRCSAARCARVSYMKHNGDSPSIEDDLELHDKLVTRPYTDKRGNYFSKSDPIHASPAEHQATPMRFTCGFQVRVDGGIWEEGTTHLDNGGNFWSGNFKGWIQYRQLL